MSAQNNRLFSLDIMRGITIASMIMVNNQGSWSYVYAPLRHATWNGLTPTDLIFPFFMFMMGITTFMSLRKFNFVFSTTLLFKIIKRTAVLFVLGMSISWVYKSLGYFHHIEDGTILHQIWQSFTNISQLRIMGVLQRLSLGYMITCIIALTIKHKYILHITLLILLGYFMVLLLGNGYASDGSSILSLIDIKVLGSNHLLRDNFDPEGLLSTIPAVCNVLLGFWCGKKLMEVKDNTLRISQLYTFGTIFTFAGFLFQYVNPINKQIWSPSFVMVTCGMAALLLGLLIYIIDIRGVKKWGNFFTPFGMNPLFIYVFGEFLSAILSQTYIPYTGGSISLKNYIYGHLLQPYFGNYFGSLMYAVIFVVLMWAIVYILQKKRIFIKI